MLDVIQLSCAKSFKSPYYVDFVQMFLTSVTENWSASAKSDFSWKREGTQVFPQPAAL